MQLAKIELKVKVAGGDSKDEALTRFVADARVIVNDLKLTSTNLAASSTEFKEKLATIIDALQKLANSLNDSESGVSPVLRAILTELRIIKARVDRISPRETVRGGP